MPPLAGAIEEAKRILEAAEQRKVTLRLFGGLAFYFSCPSTRDANLARNYLDIDLMGHSRQSREIWEVFHYLRYLPRERFNAMYGHKRLIFKDLENQRRVDVFLDSFEMCHRLDFRERLTIDRFTIPLADMLATKLQIVEINEKDLKDILSLLIDRELGDHDSPGVINGVYLAKLCSEDWGLYRTFTLNLDKLSSGLDTWNLEEDQKQAVISRIDKLRRMMDGTPKSLRWKINAKIGEKMRWYELPEADEQLRRETLRLAP